MSGSINNVHLILMVLIIVLDVISLVEHYGNIVGDYLPKWAPQVVPFIPLLLILYLFRKTNFTRDNSGRLIYRPIWRHSIKVLLALAIAAPILVFAAPRNVVSSNLPVLIADMEDYTRNQVFSGIGTRTLLALGLKQSTKLAVFPEEQMIDTLQRMKKPRQSRITDDVGLEICTREGIGPLVAWSATDSDEGYALEARILNPQNGGILKQVNVGPFDRDALIESIGQLAKKLQKSFGDSSLQIYISTKPLRAATTKSLPALLAYSEALQKLKELDYPTAEQKLVKALELDHDFALAMVELASLYDYQGNRASAIGYLKKAFEHRENLTEPERVRVKESYYWHVENDHAKSIEEINEFLKKYPRNQERLPTLAYSNFALMKFDVAGDLYQRLLGRPPWRKSLAEDAVAYWHTQLSQEEFQQALKTAAQIEKDIPDLAANPYLVIIPNVALGESQAAENEISKLRQSENTEARLWLSGFRDLYRGRLQATWEEWTQYIPLINREPRSGIPWMENEGTAHLWVARVALLAGKPKAVRQSLEQVKQGEDVGEEMLAEAGKYYARIGDLKEAQNLLDRLRSRLAERQTNQNRLLLLLLESEIELKKGNSDASFTLILQAPDYPWADLYWQAQESRAHIALATGHSDEAIKACKDMLAKKGFAFSSDRPDDWVNAHYYLARSYDSRNMKDLALNAYEEFERFWHDGDPEIPSLRFARKRIAELKQ